MVSGNSFGCLYLLIEFALTLDVQLVKVVHSFKRAWQHLFESINVDMSFLSLIDEELTRRLLTQRLNQTWLLQESRAKLRLQHRLRVLIEGDVSNHT